MAGLQGTTRLVMYAVDGPPCSALSAVLNNPMARDILPPPVCHRDRFTSATTDLHRVGSHRIKPIRSKMDQEDAIGLIYSGMVQLEFAIRRFLAFRETMSKRVAIGALRIPPIAAPRAAPIASRRVSIDLFDIRCRAPKNIR